MEQHEQGGGVAVLDPTATVPAAATANDAVILAVIYRRLAKANKDNRDAINEYRKALATGTEGLDIDGMEQTVLDTGASLTLVLKCERAAIAGLPKNVTAKGGATRQTVVMEFYGQVNRELGKRLGASDARKINAASFGN